MSRFIHLRVLATFVLLLSLTAGANGIVYNVSNRQAVGANLDLNPANTYTHKLDFPGDGVTTAINGVSFNTAAGGSFANYSLSMPSLTNFTSNGNSTVLADFIYSNTGAVGAVETLTLKQLTPGQTYDLRLYYRNFGGRPNNVVINTGSAPVLVVLDQATASNENYHSIVYRAEATEATLTFAQQSNGSWHQYGLTNQVAEPGNTVMLGGLFPTGVDANGAPIANGAADIHYNFAGGPQASAAGAQATVQANHPAWSANNGQSKWVGVTAAGTTNVAPGVYRYELNFEVPFGADPSTAIIQGSWFADDGGRILLNGVDTLVSNAAPFNTAFPGTPFTITDGMGGASFLSGTNTLAFLVSNGGTGPNPSGLRVHTLFGTAQIIPEPATATMGLLALGGLMLRRRRMA